MTITSTQAKKLCTAAELELVLLSRGDALKALTPAQLRGKVKRSRSLRDKFADLLRRQTTATQAGTGSRRGDGAEANARTQLKLQLFGEVLERFEKRHAQVQAQEARAAAKAAVPARRPRPVAAPAAPKKSRARRAAAAAPSGTPAAKPAAAAPAPAPDGKKLAKGTTAGALSPVKRSVKAPAAQRGTQVSPVVAVRGKKIGAHARSAQAKQQAKRGRR